MRFSGSGSLAQCCLCVLAALHPFATAHAQTATYSSGSIYDLDPPSKQSTANGLLESLVAARQAGNMRKIGSYAPGGLYRRLGRPVGRLAMEIRTPGGASKLGFCTASLIADDLLLTNSHCIVANQGGKAVDALLTMGYLVPDSAQGTRRYRVELEPVETDATLDYAIHRVSGAPGKTWGTVTLSSIVPVAHQSLFIIHHPAGAVQHISLGNCQAGDPPTRADRLNHICDTVGGSSGAPVFDGETRQVVGLHYRAIDPGILNAAKRMEVLVAHSTRLRRLAALAQNAATDATVTNTPQIDELARLRAELARLKAKKEAKEVVILSPGPPPPVETRSCVDVLVKGATRKRCLKPGETFRDCRNCPEMVVVPSGSFTMGSPEHEASHQRDETPQHQVIIGRPFAVGKFEVTFVEWEACLAQGGCSYQPRDQRWGRGRRPVIKVSWDDITMQYLPWLSKRTGKTYRLLTEAEWEYIARAGTTGPFSFTTRIDPANANYDSRQSYAGSPIKYLRGRTVPVNSKGFPANPWGMYHIHGNASEWVQDCYERSYNAGPTDGSAVDGPKDCHRVVRGGNWGTPPSRLRAAKRDHYRPGNRSSAVGFRVARVLGP